MELLSPHVFQHREWNLHRLQPDNFPFPLYTRRRRLSLMGEKYSDGCEGSHNGVTLRLLVVAERHTERDEGELRGSRCPPEQGQEDSEN